MGHRYNNTKKIPKFPKALCLFHLLVSTSGRKHEIDLKKVRYGATMALSRFQVSTDLLFSRWIWLP